MFEFGQPRGEAALTGTQLEGHQTKLPGVLPPLECGLTAQVLLLGGQTNGVPHAAARPARDELKLKITCTKSGGGESTSR